MKAILTATILGLIGLGESQEWMSGKFILFRPPSAIVYTEAQNICQNRYDTSLASLHNRQEMDEARALFQQPAAISENVWIGLNDRDTEGQYRNEDGTVVDFDGWAPGQPANSGVRDCAAMYRGDNFQFRAHDCNMRFAFILCNRPSNRYGIFQRKGGAGPKTTWQGARDFCKQRFGEQAALAIIHDYDEWIDSAKVTHNFCREIGVSCGAWIGFNDISTEGEWRWVDGSTRFYDAWQNSEPNNAGSGEDVAHSWGYGWDGVRNYGWNDLPNNQANWVLYALCDLRRTEKTCCETKTLSGSWPDRCPRWSGSQRRCERGARANNCEFKSCGRCLYQSGPVRYENLCPTYQSEVECLADDGGRGVCRWTPYQ